MMLESCSEYAATDGQLAEQACRGSREAFAALVGRYQGRVYRLAMRMARNRCDAEEITQETFLRAHRSIGFFRRDSGFGTWLYRIALNEALMRRRAAARRPTQSIEDLRPRLWDVGLDATVSGPERADALVEQKQLVEHVHAALASLDEAHRAALVLRDLEELSAEEAAAILSVSPNVVRQRAHRARLKLKEILEATA